MTGVLDRLKRLVVNHRFRKIVIRAMVGLASLVVCALVFGAAYESLLERKLNAGYKPPGRLVEVGSHRLHLYCIGSGEPPVVLLSGSGLTYHEWTWGAVQADLSETTRVCSYDRAGLGWSERGPESPSANQAVKDLFALLTRSGIEGPWVIVGHSLGGLYAQQFMNLHPEVVAALVLVEPTPDDMFRRKPQELERFERSFLEVVFDAVSSSRPMVGLERFWWDRFRGEPETSKWWVDKQLYRTLKHRRTAAAESRAMPESCEQVLAARVPWGDIPLLLLIGQRTWSSAGPSDIAWAREIVGRSSRGRVDVVEEAGHGIPWERPQPLVASVDSIVQTFGPASNPPR